MFPKCSTWLYHVILSRLYASVTISREYVPSLYHVTMVRHYTTWLSRDHVSSWYHVTISRDRVRYRWFNVSRRRDNSRRSCCTPRKWDIRRIIFSCCVTLCVSTPSRERSSPRCWWRTMNLWLISTRYVTQFPDKFFQYFFSKTRKKFFVFGQARANVGSTMFI